MTLFCISANELRKALADIEKAEANGFLHCFAVLEIAGQVDAYGNLLMSYSDLWERAHPTSGKLDWGRGQGVSAHNKFKNGKLIPIKRPKSND